MRYLLIGAGLMALIAPVVAEEGPRRALSRELPLAQGSDLELRLKVGELQVETAPIDQVRVEVTASCRPNSSSKCRRRLERLQMEARINDDGTLIHLTGVSKRYSKLDVRARFIVPAYSALAVKMYAGEIRVDGGGQDLDVRLKFGDATIHQPLAKTRSVIADANIGEAEIFTSHGNPKARRPFLVGSKVSWQDGLGEAQVAVNLGIGSVAVHLD